MSKADWLSDIIKLNISRFVEILKSARTRIKSATDSLRGSGETKPGSFGTFVQLIFNGVNLDTLAHTRVSCGSSWVSSSHWRDVSIVGWWNILGTSHTYVHCRALMCLCRRKETRSLVWGQKKKVEGGWGGIGEGETREGRWGGGWVEGRHLCAGKQNHSLLFQWLTLREFLWAKKYWTQEPHTLHLAWSY